jgi:hypothetical protein
MRRSVREIGEERLLILDRYIVSLGEEPEQPIGKVSSRVEALGGDMGDLFMRDLFGAFYVERRQNLHGWRIVLQERLVQV